LVLGFGTRLIRLHHILLSQRFGSSSALCFSSQTAVESFVLCSASEYPQGVTKSVPVLRCMPGELIGLMCVITGEANNCSAQASVTSRVAVLSRDNFFRLVRSYPQVLINAANLVCLRLSRLLRLADFAIEWHGVDAGKALYKQGDDSNYVYVVLNGRFREVHTNVDGSRNVIAESGRGAFLGYVEVTSAKPRMNTVLAIRDSEVVKMPSILLNWLKRLTPHPVSRFIQLLSDRLMQPTGGQTPSSTSFGTFASGSYTEGALTNLRAIAILATSPDINTEAFTLELQHAMSVFGSSLRLTSGMYSFFLELWPLPQCDSSLYVLHALPSRVDVLCCLFSKLTGFKSYYLKLRYLQSVVDYMKSLVRFSFQNYKIAIENVEALFQEQLDFRFSLC
uniref:Cyclic nucleotide-binding domain-containing protein n=1 Tax=Hydatigena taeniaeformis TaxID=6205 RepID=A0A0R3WPR0_HYDTA